MGRADAACRFFSARPLTFAREGRNYVNVNNIHTTKGLSMTVISTIDDYGKPAWITLMVLGFILYWPIGLAILAYMIWSGRMGCWKRGDWKNTDMARWRGRFGGLMPTGNAAFDEYRDETLRRLQGEADEFRTFLERLRKAKDKAEFDQFMAERRNTEGGSPSPAAS
jgi:hypothetical protein